MKKQVLAGATALVLATGMTGSAMAFNHGGGRGGGGFHSGVAGVHAGMSGSRFAGARGLGGNRFAGARSFGGNRFAGVRGFEGRRHGGWGGRRFVGGWGGGWDGGGWGYPGYYDAYAGDVGVGLVGLGIGLAEVATGSCDPYGYGWGSGYCGGYGYGTPINAWSW